MKTPKNHNEERGGAENGGGLVLGCMVKQGDVPWGQDGMGRKKEVSKEEHGGVETDGVGQDGA